MGKRKNKKAGAAKVSIQELKESRSGGQNALRGYSYQFLYSCYLLLKSIDMEDSFQLEGVEDIDHINQKREGKTITHIQLKYSINSQDASFMKSVLKNFLEAYLIDSNRSFKLVYDFQVKRGKLNKLFDSNMEEDDVVYWKNVISDIQKDTPSWNWSIYDFDAFMECISFEKVEKKLLEEEIERALIDRYEITTDNISLFVNAVKIKCFDEMEQRGLITNRDVDLVIQNVKNDISKGAINPAHSWIRKVCFDIDNPMDDSFFEGKKAMPSDIALQYPIRRSGIEENIEKSIEANTITVIRASSGQGKTTLALQCLYNLKAEYTSYQLLCCNDKRELGNITQFFKTRVRLGEKVLILIDNLDAHVREWGALVQTLYSELHGHYRVVITTRESDWFNYGGDLSEIKSINIIKPSLGEKEAKQIYDLLKKRNRLHSSVEDWRTEWNKISGKQLLIEYVYLLTHGAMLSERISAQISDIGKSQDGKIKCDILRKVSLADLSGIRLSIESLCLSLDANGEIDYGEIIKSLESEFLIHVDDDSNYIEGLHPVRSKHVFDRLHEYTPIEKTAYSLVEIVDQEYVSVLFSYYAGLNLNSYNFYVRTANLLMEEKDYSACLLAIKGAFSGSVLQYYKNNEQFFIDANKHGGLFLISTEKCPFSKFKEFNIEVSALDKLHEIIPNSNVEYLCNLRDKMDVCELNDTFVYHICKAVFDLLQQKDFSEIYDLESYAYIVEWIYHIDENFLVSNIMHPDDIWKEKDRLSINGLAALMYIAYCSNKEQYIEFTGKNLDDILLYLKHNTNSQKIYIDKERNALHVEYIICTSQISSANDLSVQRLKMFCKILPIFDFYCSDAMRPKLELLKCYEIPDDAHKEMPINNLVIMFHQELTSLWLKTIRSNFEVDTIGQWIEYWFNVRKLVCDLLDIWDDYIIRMLSSKTPGTLGKEWDSCFALYTNSIIREVLFPKEDRPFEKKNESIESFAKIKNRYFSSIQNVGNQFVGFLSRKENEKRLAMLNLINANSYIDRVHEFFGELAAKYDYMDAHIKLCDREKQSLTKALMSFEYYKTHNPDRLFNKYQIKEYYTKMRKKELDYIEESLAFVKESFDLLFPAKMYTKGMLAYYPVILYVDQFPDENLMLKLLIGCGALASAPLDYLVVLFTNKENKINSKALQISKKTFENIKLMLDTGDESIASKLTPPYPVDVTNEMIDCFEQNNSLHLNIIDDSTFISIGDIVEELWIYSTIIDISKENLDTAYYLDEAKRTKQKIEEMLKLLELHCDNEEYTWIVDVCNGVFKGERFDDVRFNSVMDSILSVTRFGI